jgi:hypothetical protein
VIRGPCGPLGLPEKGPLKQEKHFKLSHQGDQIEQIFDNWVILYFWHFFNCTFSPNFGAIRTYRQKNVFC